MGKKIRVICPLIHFFLSFWYERLILDFSGDGSVVLSIPMGGVSDSLERAMTYIIAKIIALVFIVCIWRIVFFIIDDGFKSLYIRCFVAAFAIGLIVLVLCFPNAFVHSEDNLITYSYAVKLWPEYWHSAYSSMVYAACMMVAPSGIMISIMQWFGFCAAFGYLYHRLSCIPQISKAKRKLLFLLLLVPDLFFVLTDGYRTEQYGILCIFYMSIVTGDILEKRKRNGFELLGLALLSAFIGVWRSEGMILGVLGFVALVLFVYELSAVKKCIYVLLILALFVLMGIPQRLGNTKYYGKDYSFINSFPTLHNILCAESANLTYEGAESDKAAINEVVPLELVALYGMEGYRRYNYSEGRPDINQSQASKETGEAYMKAYYNIVLHNPVIYAKNQLSFLLQAIKLRKLPYIESCRMPVEEFPEYYFAGWDIGRKILKDTSYAFMYSEKRANISHGIIGIFSKYLEICSKFYVFSALLIISVLFEIYIFLRGFVLLCKKNTEKAGFAIFALILLMQAAAIVLVMPAGVLAYFHGYFYSTFVLELVYIISSNRKVFNKK